MMKGRMMNLKRSTLIMAAFALFVSVPLFGQMNDHEGMQMKTVDAKDSVKSESNSYPLDYCIVSGEKLDSMSKPITYDYNGREIKFCCQGCLETFKKDPAAYIKKLDDAIIAAQKDSYPYTICPVTGEKLGEMGPVVDYVYNNQLVRFCCPACPPIFEKDPEKYMKILHSQTPQNMEMQQSSGEGTSPGMEMHHGESHDAVHSR
jgi:YHS domain-containing protein